MHIVKQVLYSLSLFLMICVHTQCKEEKKETTIEKETTTPKMIAIKKSDFGTTSEGKKVEHYQLKNANGMEVDVITFGGRITSIKVPNKAGEIEDVVLGFNNIAQYTKDNPFFGALIGRYGNRIAKGKFTLNDTEYTLATNNGENHLHGGVDGFDNVIWTAEAIEGEENSTLKLTYLSKDGEEGYPGNLTTTVVYRLTKDNALEVSYHSITDKVTIINLTQHTYFNLSGDPSTTILDHEVMINADAYIPVDSTLIPTGEIAEVASTPFDFRTPKLIKQDINVANEQLKRGLGYDHCWVLNDQIKGMRLAASVYHPGSGRVLEVFSDEPGIQFYTGNFLDGTLPTKTTGTYAHRTGFCLETQHYPDSPNQKDFPSVILQPGETYQTKTIFKFSTK